MKSLQRRCFSRPDESSFINGIELFVDGRGSADLITALADLQTPWLQPSSRTSLGRLSFAA
jgi:hypothetical protein